ncbi:MAG: hypothetical protein N3E51_02730 [Candidatus Micrarchaeota archaeon]|nr:hypothetical protein [Candidatus Micrarchaeota archaeon]
MEWMTQYGVTKNFAPRKRFLFEGKECLIGPDGSDKRIMECSLPPFSGQQIAKGKLAEAHIKAYEEMKEHTKSIYGTQEVFPFLVGPVARDTLRSVEVHGTGLFKPARDIMCWAGHLHIRHENLNTPSGQVNLEFMDKLYRSIQHVLPFVLTGTSSYRTHEQLVPSNQIRMRAYMPEDENYTPEYALDASRKELLALQRGTRFDIVFSPCKSGKPDTIEIRPPSGGLWLGKEAWDIISGAVFDDFKPGTVFDPTSDIASNPNYKKEFHLSWSMGYRAPVLRGNCILTKQLSKEDLEEGNFRHMLLKHAYQLHVSRRQEWYSLAPPDVEELVRAATDNGFGYKDFRKAIRNMFLYPQVCNRIIWQITERYMRKSSNGNQPRLSEVLISLAQDLEKNDRQGLEALSIFLTHRKRSIKPSSITPGFVFQPTEEEGYSQLSFTFSSAKDKAVLEQNPAGAISNVLEALKEDWHRNEADRKYVWLTGPNVLMYVKAPHLIRACLDNDFMLKSALKQVTDGSVWFLMERNLDFEPPQQAK